MLDSTLLKKWPISITRYFLPYESPKLSPLRSLLTPHSQSSADSLPVDRGFGQVRATAQYSTNELRGQMTLEYWDKNAKFLLSSHEKMTRCILSGNALLLSNAEKLQIQEKKFSE